jgi:hypothetical protein
MKIRHVTVRNFRGIVALDWAVTADFVCLIGSGDSGKTTILDAISYALTSRWSLPINDADFYRGSPDLPIEIEITIVDPPAELLPEEPKFGLFLRGFSPTGELHDDPGENDTPALTIRFSVDRSLEPRWSVIKNSIPEGKPIRSADRAKLKVFRVAETSDHHLGWGRGSSLAALTGDLDDLSGTLASAHRVARQAFAQDAPEELRLAAATAHAAAKSLAARGGTPLSPRLRRERPSPMSSGR